MEQLEQFIADGDAAGLEDLLAAQPQLAQQLTSQQVTPLMLSCYYRKPDLTAILLQHVTSLTLFEAAAAGKFDEVAHHVSTSPNDIDRYAGDGFTALGLACYFGHYDVARYLVLKGADVNLPSNNGFNVFPIHSACAGNYTDIAQMLIENGAKVNVKQQAGATPLHSAAQNGNIEILVMLLEAGAEINTRMEGGRMPADVARDKGFTEIAEILS